MKRIILINDINYNPITVKNIKSLPIDSLGEILHLYGSKKDVMYLKLKIDIHFYEVFFIIFYTQVS